MLSRRFHDAHSCFETTFRQHNFGTHVHYFGLLSNIYTYIISVILRSRLSKTTCGIHGLWQHKYISDDDNRCCFTRIFTEFKNKKDDKRYNRTPSNLILSRLKPIFPRTLKGNLHGRSSHRQRLDMLRGHIKSREREE